MSVRNAARRLKKEGVDPQVQLNLDLACVHPHIHPRHLRNEE